ncbi:HEPN domain-containing protein [Thermofilum adornatum]|uniref:HEPN domain-containing protein n=1 Tax=Thermofilum adornatum TaxID=1365176 RepID=UPI000B2B262D
MARELDRHYIPARYPNAFPSGTPHEAYDEEISRRAIEACEEIIRFVRREFEQSRD